MVDHWLLVVRLPDNTLAITTTLGGLTTVCCAPNLTPQTRSIQHISYSVSWWHALGSNKLWKSIYKQSTVTLSSLS